MDGCSIYLGGGVADTRAMRQDRYQIARNSIIHAELLVNIANRALGDEAPNSEQDHELTADVYKLARGCEALNDTLAAAIPDDLMCPCGHTAHWHSEGGRGKCEYGAPSDCDCQSIGEGAEGGEES